MKKFIMYIWSLTTRKIYVRHLKIIVEKTNIVLPSSIILNQMFCFKNDQFLYEKSKKPIFHKT
jgi:hypothetical protein